MGWLRLLVEGLDGLLGEGLLLPRGSSGDQDLLLVLLAHLLQLLLKQEIVSILPWYSTATIKLQSELGDMCPIFVSSQAAQPTCWISEEKGAKVLLAPCSQVPCSGGV